MERSRVRTYFQVLRTVVASTARCSTPPGPASAATTRTKAKQTVEAAVTVTSASTFFHVFHVKFCFGIFFGILNDITTRSSQSVCISIYLQSWDEED